MFPVIEIERAASLIERNEELAERQHLFIISDESRDSFDTVFKMSGWDLSRRKMKKRVTYGHPSYNDTDDTNIIGIGEERISDKLYSLLTLEPAEINPKAERVHQKLLFGSLTDASIRCTVEDGRMGDESRGEDPSVFYFTRQTLVDWGVVMEGSNANATKVRSAIEDFIRSKVPAKYQDHIMYLRALKTRYYIQ